MSAACAPVFDKPPDVRADAHDAVAGQKERPADSYREPASFPPIDTTFTIAPGALPSDPQHDGDLLGKLSEMYADQTETRTPPESASVVADRQAESLAKSLSLPATSPPRQNTFTIAPRALPSDPQIDSDLLGKLSAMYADQTETRTPTESLSQNRLGKGDSPIRRGGFGTVPDGSVADRQAESLAKSLSVPASSTPRQNTFTIMPRALPSNPQIDSDLLGKLSAMYADQGESDAETPPPSVASTADGTAARPLNSVAQVPHSAAGAPASEDPSPVLSALDGAIAEIPAVENPLAGVPSLEVPPTQVPSAEDPRAGNRVRDRLLALLPSLPSMSSRQDERRDASPEATDQIANTDPDKTEEARTPGPDQGKSPGIAAADNTTGTPAATQSPAPPAVQALLSHWHRLRYGRQAAEAAAVPTPLLADATQPLAPGASDSTEALNDSPDAIGAADTSEPPVAYGRQPATMPTRDDQLVTTFENERVATPEESAPVTPAEPAPIAATERPSSTPGLPPSWGGQPFAIPGVPAGAAPGQVVVVVVVPPGGASPTAIPQPVYAQPLVAAPQPAGPLATTDYASSGPNFDSPFANGPDSPADDYAPARLALQLGGQGAAPLAPDDVDEGTLPAPPETTRPTPPQPSAQPGEPGAAADTLAEAEKLGEEPVDNRLQFLRRETVLLEPGEWQFDVGLVYSYQQNDIPIAVLDGMGNITDVVEGQIRQRELFLPLAVRVGATERVQLFLNAPVGWANTELSFVSSDEFENDGGIGDVTLGSSLLVNTNEFRDVVFTLAITAPTGDNPFGPVGAALPVAALGEGFWSFFGELLCIQTYDPVVLFTSIGTQQSVQREFLGREILPGGEYFWTFGAGLAVNPRVTFSTRFLAQYVSETTIDGDRVPGTIQEPMAIRMAATIAQPDYFVEPFVQFGTNDDAIDTLFGVVWTY